MVKERRRTPRFSDDQIVELGFGTETIVWAETVNISRKGLLCRCFVGIPLQTPVILSMVLPSGARVEGEGIVVRSDRTKWEHLVALRFTLFVGSGSEDLEHYLSRLGMSAGVPKRAGVVRALLVGRKSYHRSIGAQEGR